MVQVEGLQMNCPICQGEQHWPGDITTRWNVLCWGCGIDVRCGVENQFFFRFERQQFLGRQAPTIFSTDGVYDQETMERKLKLLAFQ